MWKNFKNWFQKNFYNKQAQLRERYLDIKNHDVEINGTEYFLAKAMIPDIPEILGIERAVYGGQTPWDERAFRTELMRKNDRLYLVLRRNDWLVASLAVHSMIIPGIVTLPTLPSHQLFRTTALVTFWLIQLLKRPGS